MRERWLSGWDLLLASETVEAACMLSLDGSVRHYDALGLERALHTTFRGFVLGNWNALEVLPGKEEEALSGAWVLARALQRDLAAARGEDFAALFCDVWVPEIFALGSPVVSAWDTYRLVIGFECRTATPVEEPLSPEDEALFAHRRYRRDLASDPALGGWPEIRIERAIERNQFQLYWETKVLQQDPAELVALHERGIAKARWRESANPEALPPPLALRRRWSDH